MTPRTVVFSLPDDLTVGEFFLTNYTQRFSRIPGYRQEPERITGYVLRSDLLEAQAKGESSDTLKGHKRDLPALLSSMSMSKAFDEIQRRRTHILLAVDEYGGVEGILTLEDVLETLLGLEIVDESDTSVDMQKLARRLWQRREPRVKREP
jgi:CBS domain containing-hemolysin-like protein